jgi:hypothetical protein
MSRSRFHRNIDFNSLSVRDLLEARDQFHTHLANLENVSGTAVGRYLIRNTDPDFHDPHSRAKPPDYSPRTLTNSAVTPWSWPCVLVFVDKWKATR